MKRYVTSSDSEDDEPLVNSRPGNQYQVITKDDLLERTLEKCEFCDSVFYDKYNILIHNARHIIIPLLKQSIHQCTKCNSHFNSKESLEKHELSHHLNITNQKDYPEILSSIMSTEPYAVLTKEEFQIKDESSNTDILESLVLKEPVMLLTKQEFAIEKEEVFDDDDETKLLESFVNKNPITLVNPLVLRNEVEVIDISDESNSIDSDIKTYFQENSIKNRILFEDDDNIFETVNSDEGEEKLVNSDIRGSLKMNTIILGKHPSDVEYKSVHYDELVKPGLYKCRKCDSSFPNRYELIVHDTNHMRFKRRTPYLCKMCDWYVSNNPWGLKTHQQARHPDRGNPNTEVTRCRRCNLNYVHFYRHLRNYHDTYTCRLPACNISIEGYYEYLLHKATHKNGSHLSVPEEYDKDLGNEDWYRKTLKVCDMCYLFLKNKSNAQYTLLKIVSEVGVRQHCDQCGTKFFELNLVEFKAKKRAVYPPHKKKIQVTNEDRLKSVQKRLKKLKFMNKF